MNPTETAKTGIRARSLGIFPLLTALLGLAAAQPASGQTPDCASPRHLCVGAGQKFATIQAAADAAIPGDTVWVFDGTYAGFRVTKTATRDLPIVFRAAGPNVVIGSRSSAARTNDNIEIASGAFIQVTGFRVRDALRAGISVIDARDVTISENTVGPNERWGIFSGFSPNIRVVNNKTFGSRREHGIYLSNSATPNDNYLVIGNESWGNNFSGVQLNGDCHSGANSDGRIEGAILEGNIIHDNNGKGFSLISAPGVIVRNNVLYSNGKVNGAGGIHLTDESGCNAPSSRAIIVNNTVVEPRIAALRITDNAREAVVFNNVFISRLPAVDEVGASFLDTASNLRRTSAPANLFVNAPSANYRPAPGGLAAGAGIALYRSESAPSMDLDGSPRKAPFDAGAYSSTAPAPQDSLPPTVPEALTAVADGARVKLSWSPSSDPLPLNLRSSGVAGYRIFRDGVEVATSVEPTYLDDGPGTGGSARYAVLAFDGAGNQSAQTPPLLYGLAIQSLSLAPERATGGSAVTLTVQLTATAPPGGWTIPLRSSNAALAAPPAEVTVPAGASSAQAAVNTTAVTAETPVTLTAGSGADAKSATLTLTPPPAVQPTLALSPSRISGGLRASYNRVTLSEPAPAGGATVTLASSDPSVTVPASIAVPEGTRVSPYFVITTRAVDAQTRVVITASLGDASASATLTVLPPALSSLWLSRTSVESGRTVTGNRVRLTSAAGPAGLVVNLTSDNPELAGLPASITIAPGATASPYFTISTKTVAAPVTVTLRAESAGTVKTATLTLLPTP